MDIKATRNEIFEALQTVIGVVERRQSLPILGNVLLDVKEDHLELQTTDLEVQISCKIKIQNLQPGRVTAPARKLYDICHGLPDGASLQLKTDAGKLRVHSGRSRFALATLPADTFPELETVEQSASLQLKAATLKSLIVRTQFAMAQQDVRYYLNGLLLEVKDTGLRSVATDGHRLGISEEPVEQTGEAKGQFIIPRKTVMELVRLLDEPEQEVTVKLSPGQLTMQTAEVSLVSKLIDGNYPEYRRVIPEEGENKVIAHRETVRKALSRAAILSNEKFRGVRLKFSPGIMEIETQNPEQEEAREEVEVAYEGEKIEIGFNVTYLVDALNAMDGENVVVDLRGADSSGLLYNPECPQHRYVVMPMRL